MLALSLVDSSLRTQLRNHLRDTPFENHRIALQPYLSGQAGQALLVKMARLGGSSPSRIMETLHDFPPLEIALDGVLDRLFWKGTSDIIVYGLSVPAATLFAGGQLSLVGFDVNGTAQNLTLGETANRRLLVIQPATDPFPTDAEDRRAAAPRQTRLTVSTPDEERARLLEVGQREIQHSAASASDPKIRNQIICDWRGEYCYDDDPPPEPLQGGVDLPAGIDQEHCFGYVVTLDGTNDIDQDGVLDSCEFPIAYAMRPVLNIGNDDGAPLREPYMSVSRHPTKANTLQIIYALAYHRDAGTPFLWGAGGHEGDSEFIIFEVSNPKGFAYGEQVETRWRLDYATLSAHYGDGSFDHTATYWAEDLEYTIYWRARPRIWVSLGKHANYRNHSVCGTSWYNGVWNDTCAGSYLAGDTDIRDDENLGNYYSFPPGGVRLMTFPTVSRYGRPGTENFWFDAGFGGWSGQHNPGVTPYWQIFSAFGF